MEFDSVYDMIWSRGILPSYVHWMVSRGEGLISRESRYQFITDLNENLNK